MYEYIKGNIIDVDTNYVIIENNGIGYIVYVANPYSYKIGDNKIYIYKYIKYIIILYI